MSHHKLFIDRRVAVTGSKSKIHLDNPVAIHTFIETVLKELPQHGSNGDALTAGLVAGDLYWNTAATPIITIVV